MLSESSKQQQQPPLPNGLKAFHPESRSVQCIANCRISSSSPNKEPCCDWDYLYNLHNWWLQNTTMQSCYTTGFPFLAIVSNSHSNGKSFTKRKSKPESKQKPQLTIRKGGEMESFWLMLGNCFHYARFSLIVIGLYVMVWTLFTQPG